MTIPGAVRSEKSVRTVCDQCGAERHGSDDYDPIKLVAGEPCGWYSGADGDLCGDCLKFRYVIANMTVPWETA